MLQLENTVNYSTLGPLYCEEETHFSSLSSRSLHSLLSLLLLILSFLSCHSLLLHPTFTPQSGPPSTSVISVNIDHHHIMSHYPRYGFYPSPHPQSFYPHPNQPIPHRGGPISSTQSRASSTSLAALATPTEEEDAALPDGGWGRDGPLMQARKARGKYTQGRRVNSKDKTANSLRTSQSGPSAPPVEVRQLSCARGRDVS
jgi:hypothetical protein